MADMTYRESGDENESPLVERTAVPVASIAVNTSRRDLGLVMVRRRLVFVGVRNEREYAGLFGSISAFLFGLVERLIRRLDQVGGGGIPAGNRTGKTRADRGDTTVGVRDAEGFEPGPNRVVQVAGSSFGTLSRLHALSAENAKWPRIHAG